MRAVYTIKTCCGDFVERIEIEVPAGCTEPDDLEAEQVALEQSGYAGYGRCGGCGDQRYRACFAGYPIEVPFPVNMTVEAENRNALVAALEAVLSAVRDAPDYVSFVEVGDRGARIG